MTKAEILAQLPKLKPCELAEAQAKLDELIGDAWLNNGELSDADRSALDSSLADFQKDPDAGSSWNQVKARIEVKLSQ